MQVGELWRSYCRKIETDPIKAKAITSFLGFMIGDTIAQKVEGHTFNPVRYPSALEMPVINCHYGLLLMHQQHALAWRSSCIAVESL